MVQPDTEIQRFLFDRDILIGLDGSILEEGMIAYVLKDDLRGLVKIDVFWESCFLEHWQAYASCSCFQRPLYYGEPQPEYYKPTEMISAATGPIARKIRLLQRKIRAIRQMRYQCRMISMGVCLALTYRRQWVSA